ncbi:MAG: acyl-CoA/acyl-ACP dehydrogenase [Dehalococcoidales bacterium]|nr:acyl-CoA/acyl-ACP dehydrogenase [Dehalococcoidales bacterium]
MDFSLTEEQELLKKTARDFLEKECPKTLVRKMEDDELGYSPQLWDNMAGLGWMALPFPEKYGGSEGSFSDLVILLEEMGRACLPSPFISTVVLGGLTISDMGSEKQKETLLSRIAKGQMSCAFALLESDDTYKPAGISCRAILNENGLILTGTKLFVQDARVADYIVVAVRTGSGSTEHGITLVLIDSKSPGIEYTPLKSIAGNKQFEVKFDGVKVPYEGVIGKLGEAGEGLERTLARAAVAKCAEMVGGAQRVLEMTVEYAKNRIQFGRPIGSLQAIQHYCAKIATDVDASRLNTYKAAWMIDKGLPYAKQVSLAKAWCNEAYYRVTALSHQIHGAIGWTKDMDLELYTRRAKSAEFAFGSADFHREVIAREMGLIAD